LLGERCPAWNPHARGAWVGLAAAHTARDLHQSVVEGITFSLKSVLQRIEALVGPQDRITVARRREGEGDLLVHRASIYRRKLALLGTAEPTALGAMIVAAVGAGLYESVADAVHYVTGAQQIIEPREDLARDYKRLFELYQAASATTRQVTGQWDASAVN
jgi:xylulokinase